jgi:ribosomal protein S18 acetylase RimI-like enzyme
MMRGLAEFERYLEEFVVTESDLERRAFGSDPECRITVAEDGASGELLGYAVTVSTPFTYDLKPTVTLKELYVREPARSRGVGRALFQAVAAGAIEAGAGRLKWEVLSGNRRAEAFYRSLGGRRVRKWIPYSMDARGFRELAFRKPPSARVKPFSRSKGS